MANCIHERHKNIIHTQIHRVMYLSHKQNRTFIIVNETAFVIDSTNYIEKCPHCKISYHIYIYGTWPDVRASFDGATNLPICATVDNIVGFLPLVYVYSEPRFGKNFIYGMSGLYYPLGEIRYFIIHCIKENIEGIKNISKSTYKFLFVNNKPAVCCRNINDEFILINSDGIIIETEVSYSQESHTFKIGNGNLNYNRNKSGVFWTYISAPALNTKPAVASANCADE
jgi:hypothetical protein